MGYMSSEGTRFNLFGHLQLGFEIGKRRRLGCDREREKFGEDYLVQSLGILDEDFLAGDVPGNDIGQAFIGERQHTAQND